MIKPITYNFKTPEAAKLFYHDTQELSLTAGYDGKCSVKVHPLCKMDRETASYMAGRRAVEER